MKKQGADLHDGCAQSRFYANPNCGLYGLVQGEFTEDWDSNEPFPDDRGPRAIHDGDTGGNMCPETMAGIDMATLDPNGGMRSWTTDLRTDTSRDGIIHLEWNWCRHYGGDVLLAAETNDAGAPTYPATRLRFAPTTGDQVSAMGEWLMDFSTTSMRTRADADGGKAEIHEVWMFSALAPAGSSDAGPPSAGYGHAMDFRVSAQFPRDLLVMELPSVIPPRPASESALTKLVCRQVQPEAGGGGCARPNVKVTERWRATPDGGVLLVKVTLPVDPIERHQLLSDYNCSGFQCGTTGILPCNDMYCVDKVRQQYGRCDVPGGKPAFSGVIRCNWEDPLDLWECGDCGCQDSAALDRRIPAPVVGCAPVGLDPANPDDRRKACEAVCGDLVCGIAPACRIGTCRSPSAAAPASARLLARDACKPPPPVDRISPVGDYRVDFGPASSIRFGKVNAQGTLDSFSETATTRASGFAHFNVAQLASSVSALELSDLEIAGEAFSYATLTPVPPFVVAHAVSNETAVMLQRTRGTLRDATHFEIAPGRLLLAARAIHDGTPGGAELVNQGSMAGTFDVAAGTFTLDGAGRDDDGLAVLLHLEGTITNHPPSAAFGSDRAVECTSPAATPVTLDGRASTDVDPGDAITHFQWFENLLRHEPDEPDVDVPVDVGIGVGPTVTTLASLGDHSYELHAYDKDLGSGMTRQHVRVADTTPPALSVEPPSVCLWPPNHTFALFTLGQELKFAAADACDQNPQVWIDSVVSNEPSVGGGSGNTDPDVTFGTQSACVRSERAGTGVGRNYTVTVKARDAACNVTTKTVGVVVPHDMSGHSGCERAVGMDLPDARCLTGAPVPPCVPH